MKEICIISFKLKKCNLAQRTAIQRALRGYIDYSNKGSHRYEREGKLKKIPHKILNKGVIMLNKEDKQKITPILKKNKADVMIINLFSKKDPFKD